MLGFKLSGDNIKLGYHEIKQLFKPNDIDLVEDILMADSKYNYQLIDRLAYFHTVYAPVFVSSYEELLNTMRGIEWQEYIKDTFFISLVHNEKFDPKEFAEIVWDKLKSPKVSSKGTVIELIFYDQIVFCGIRLQKNTKDYLKRIPTKRAVITPTTVQSKLARAMINLTSAVTGTIVDPFCGSGAILVEATSMGLKAKGYDIDYFAVEKAKKNIAHFKSDAVVEHNDFQNLNENWEFVVTDLPYGKNSLLSDAREDLYIDFIEVLKRNLTGIAVLMYPHYSNFHQYVVDFNIICEIEIPIHKSLTRKIIVLSKK